MSNPGLVHNDKLLRKPLSPKRLTIRTLLRPHTGALVLGLLAVIGESTANLLEPWPLFEIMESSPAILVNWRSSGVATAEAMVSGFAPGRPAETLMVG